MLKVLKKIFFWNYPRNTWQWDALCVLILAFIFLTPKSWFLNGERRALEPHQTPIISTVFVDSDVLENKEDMVQIEERVRTITGRPEVKVVGVRKRFGKDGSVLGYEVDIR